MADKSMDTYLNDHLAGAMFGAELARQLQSQTAGSERARWFSELADQIEADRQTLSELMDRLGTSRNPVKQATTWLAEKFSRVKLSELGSGADELGLFMAIETLALGVEGKACLWRELRDVADRYPALRESELDALVGRAEDQRRMLEAERAAAGRRVFAAPPR